MNANILKLAEIASEQTGGPREDASIEGGGLPPGLASLLDVKNGFYAFESALHVYSTSPTLDEPCLAEWNSPGLWRESYEGLDEGLFFFAEDIFGEQFAIGDGGVYRFNPETGKRDHLAATIDEWAGLVLQHYKVETGYPLAHEWQKTNGRLPIGSRLIPKMFFVFGGEYSVQNLYAMDATTSMRLRGDVAVQLRDIPDGAKVRIKIVE